MVLTQRLVTLLKFFQQDPPGDPIHCQMVDHHQESARSLRSQIVVNYTQERTAAQIQTGLDLHYIPIEPRAMFYGRNVSPIPALERRGSIGSRTPLTPLPLAVLKAQS